MLYIASDHGGFELKQDLVSFLDNFGVPYQDLGPAKFVDGDDYPDYAEKVAKKVSANPAKNNGILLCRSGQGVCFVANKFPHVRAVMAWNEAVAKASRNDDDSNILCLPSDYISTEVAEEIVAAWLETKFSFEPRHIRRLEKLADIETAAKKLN